MRMHLRLAAAVVLTASVTACANLPTSGSVQMGSLQGPGGQAQPGIQIVPVPPGRAWGPTDIVNGFLAASASFDNNYAVAREYLTAGFSRWWRPGLAATVIDSPLVSPDPSPPKSIVNVGPPFKLVSVTGQHFAKLQTAGPNQAGKLVVTPGRSTYRFSLIQKQGVWRIESISLGAKPAKRSLLLLTSSDFERDYQTRNLYFYPARSTASALVPDPVYIPQRPGNSGLEILVNTLLHAPRPSSWLYGAATTEFPRGTKLISVTVVGGIKAVVDLGGAAVRASQAQRQRMAAQLYWTFKNSPFGTQGASQIRSVVLEINHHSLQVLPPQYAGLVPRGASAPLYFQVPGESAGPAVAALRDGATQPGPVSLPKGLGSGPFAAIAVSTPLAGSAVLAGCSGKYVYLMPQSHAGAVIKKRLPADCTSLSWDVRGNLWATAGTGAVLLPGARGGSPGQPVPVQIPPLSPTAVVESLRVAPDGVRVAMIVRSGSSTRILVAAISRTTSFTYLAQHQMLRVGSDIAKPVALTWLDPDHLLVLGRSGLARTEMFEVPLNGGDSTEIATPRGVTSLAASWPYGQVNPHVVIGIAATDTTPGKIEMSRTGLLNPDWVLVAKGISPVLPG